jgi:dipeptidyl aminopeptidase/acylaminoacyl peptidase
MLVAALREKGVPHSYLLFAGEQHGFRKAENIRAALDGELSFYAQVLGFDLPPDEGIVPITLSS